MKPTMLIRELEKEIYDDILLALKEDIGSGDLTTSILIPSGRTIKARIIAKSSGIICGLDVAGLVFDTVDRKIILSKKLNDGDSARSGQVIANVSGPAAGILSAERTALNFLQRLSGIATLTNAYVRKVKGYSAKILDTRKTTPGLRALEKYAVKMGGGMNHRIGLFDAVLIKDNHIAVAGGVSRTVRMARKKYKIVEVEVGTAAQLKEAISAGATRIMLDNMSIPAMKKAIKTIRSADRRIEIEASGNVTIDNVSDIARTGVDYISVGAITHSAPALDISLKV